VSSIAKRRWLEKAGNLADKTLYRPKTLEGVKGGLEQLKPEEFGLGGELKENVKFELYEVQPRDTLIRIARQFYATPDYKRIWQFNLDKIENPDRIYPGQVLKIPL
jgi:nucleoid-associated protein YgaU